MIRSVIKDNVRGEGHSNAKKNRDVVRSNPYVLMAKSSHFVPTSREKTFHNSREK